MTKAPRVAIAGAGIAGITAAYFEAMKGHQVFLIEPNSSAGGLLRSEHTPFGSFDYGTHIGTYTGIGQLDEFLFSGMSEKNFNFFNPGLGGNYYAGSLSEIAPFVDIRLMGTALTQQAELELLNAQGVSSAANLEQLMVARFGPTIYREVFSGVVEKLMGCSAQHLSVEAINFFDMNRVLAFDAAVSERLKRESKYNDSLGFHYAHPGMQKVYPRAGGIGYWVTFLMDKLRAAGVQLLANTSIHGISHEGGRVSRLDLGAESLQVDQLIWSIPPALYASLVASSSSFPRPKFRKSAVYDFAFVKPLASACYFINVYDASKYSGRITLYPNLTPAGEYYTCTVEVLGADDFDFEGITATVLDELRSIGIVGQDNRCAYMAKRDVSNGFPLPELDYSEQTRALTASLDAAFDNVTFIGRAPGRFFMSEVLTHACQVVCGDAHQAN